MNLSVEILGVAVTLFHYYTYMKSLKTVQTSKLMISCLFLALKLKNRLNSKSLLELKNCFNKYADCQQVEQQEINAFEMELLIFLGFELDIETSFTSFESLYYCLNIKEFLTIILNSDSIQLENDDDYCYDKKYKFIKYVKLIKSEEKELIENKNCNNNELADVVSASNNVSNNNLSLINENQNSKRNEESKEFNYNINVSDTPDENYNDQNNSCQKMLIEENIDYKNMITMNVNDRIKKQTDLLNSESNKRKTIEIVDDSKNLNQILKDDKIYKIEDLKQSEEKFLSLFKNLCFTVLLDVYRRPFCIVFKSKSIAYSIFLLCLDLIISEYKLNIEVDEKIFLDEYYKDVDYNDFINCRKEIITFMNSCQW